MIRLSTIILTHNNEDMVADCIDTVSFSDEIIVIDSESTDRTVDIAKHLGARVYTTTSKSFADKRTLGKEKAKGEWLFYIDTDERVDSLLRASIAGSMKDERFVAYRLHRKNFYLGNHEWPTIEKLERLFRKDALKAWKGELHETAVVDGTVGELDGFLLHYTHRDLSSMLQKTMVWSEVEAELRLRAHHPPMTWWRFPRVMITAFWDSYVKQRGYTVGIVGIIESIYQAFSIFVTYARLWELQQKVKHKT